MRRYARFVSLALVFAILACGKQTSTPEVEPQPTLSSFGSDSTIYGFFPSPPEATLDSVLNHFEALGEYADFILIQPNIPWEDFIAGVEGESQSRTDLRNQTVLAQQNGLGWIFVVDPLNGLNRREFFGLPESWEASFANPDVREAYSNFTLWIVREFKPKYLGLASEINTYLDAHPDDVQHYLSLYRQIYDKVKAEAPNTQVFVTFQWAVLNNLVPSVAEGRPPYQTNWDQIEAFEPKLDLWVISTYPFIVFNSGSEIPEDYYTPLLERTDKPLAVAEGGYTSQQVGPIPGDPIDQVHYLQAIYNQIGVRLDFWVYLILNDLKMESIARSMEEQGRSERDINTLGMFAFLGLREADGTPKPGLDAWNEFRGAD